MNKTLDKIITFAPLYKQVIWGGSWIAQLKGENLQLPNIGESWEISAVNGNESVVDEGNQKGMTLNQLTETYGEELLGSKVVGTYGKTFPLLIKLIDALDNLSLQVHPDDELAAKRHNSRGKTEMWYIIDARPDAKIYCGLKGTLTADNFAEHVRTNIIMDDVMTYPSQAGQFYFIPAGTLHAIGAGNLIAEIQESSDITYRVYDHNRVGKDGKPRQLHIDESREAIDYTFPNDVEPTAKIFDTTKPEAVSCEYFTVDYLAVTDGEAISIKPTGQSFIVVMAVNGSITVKADGSSRTLTAGHTALIPASAQSLEISGSGKALYIYI